MILQLREIVFSVAEEFDLGEIEETLKWRELSYKSKNGSPVRMDWKLKALAGVKCLMEIIESTILCLLFISTIAIAEVSKMNGQEAQRTWDEYHNRMKNRRLAEAKIIILELEKHYITSETDLVLDFSIFTPDEEGAKGIHDQLNENYEMFIEKEDEYWLIKGTTRPYAVNLSSEQHLEWVEYMHDVSLSYGGIFSTWSISDPKTNSIWSNENIETEFD